MVIVLDSENCAQNISPIKGKQNDKDDENAAAFGTTLSCRDSVRQERSLLFQPSGTASRTGSSGRGKKKKNSCPQRTWTVQLVCLSSRFGKKTPATNEKNLLLQAGLAGV